MMNKEVMERTMFDSGHSDAHLHLPRAHRSREERGDGGRSGGADRSRLGRAKNVSPFFWRNFNCPRGGWGGGLLIGPERVLIQQQR